MPNEDAAITYLENLRKECMARGHSGIKGLGCLFRALDANYSKGICLPEFLKGMKQYNIKMGDDQLKILFNYLDTDKSGTIDFAEFLHKLKPPMPQCRVDVVNQAFDKLDVIKDGILKVDDMKAIYKSNAEKHPKYLSGEWTLDETLQSFLTGFDSPVDPDGMVTRDEFMAYYSVWSNTIDDNSYFDRIMRSIWGLPEKGQ